jgi:predicted DNA-binding transcriptional regulator AlpA
MRNAAKWSAKAQSSSASWIHDLAAWTGRWAQSRPRPTLEAAPQADFPSTPQTASHDELDADGTAQDSAAPQQQGTAVTGRTDGSIGLVGSTEIRELLGLCRSRIYQITCQSDFPAPVAHLANGRVWLTEEVLAWIAECRN